MLPNTILVHRMGSIMSFLDIRVTLESRPTHIDHIPGSWMIRITNTDKFKLRSKSVFVPFFIRFLLESIQQSEGHAFNHLILKD